MSKLLTVVVVYQPRENPYYANLDLYLKKKNKTEEIEAIETKLPAEEEVEEEFEEDEQEEELTEQERRMNSLILQLPA